MLANERSGELQPITTTGSLLKAFIPKPLPPQPPLALTGRDHQALERANFALGRLDSLGILLPDPHLFVYFYLRKEAVLSSQIEGTQSSLEDLLQYESHQTPGVPLDDVVEVSNYVGAIQHGLDRLRGKFPLSNRLLREVHEKLLSNARGSNKMPGDFRNSQVYIVGHDPTSPEFVPPPAPEVPRCMADLERFINGAPESEPVPVLIRAALAHAQFETIHPFLDGNGRLGRLLIPLILCNEQVLREPTLYLSLYFKVHRQQYYDRLQRIRTHGEWEEWVRFFLDGVRFTAENAVATAQAILALFEDNRSRITAIGRRAGNVLRIHEVLKRTPIISISTCAKLTELTAPTVTAGFADLVGLSLLNETTDRKRGKLFAYKPYLDLLNEKVVA